MKALKANWAQVVCWVVVVGALAWAGFTVYTSGLDNTKEELGVREAKSDLGTALTKVENKQFPEVFMVMTVKPGMLPEKPADAPMPVDNISNPPHNFYVGPDLTPVQPVQDNKPKPPVPGTEVVPPKDRTLNAYILPAHMEVYQVYDGNELVVYMPWPEEHAMTVITGFVIQRQEMRNDTKQGWIPKDNTWVTLPKYLVADEAKAGAVEEPVVTPGGTPPPVKPRPAPLGLTGLSTGPATTTPAAPTFDLKKYQGIYVIFDKLAQSDETRYNYRVAMIGKLLGTAADKQVDEDGVKWNLHPAIPKAIATDYTTADGAALKVFAPSESIAPTPTGKIQVKFVTPGEDPTKSASFIVMRGISQSSVTNVLAGDEIAADLTVFNSKGTPVVDAAGGGIKKETVSTGLIYDRVEVDDGAKKTYAVLRDRKKVEIKIEQGKSNGNPKEPEVDLALLNKILVARADEYKKMFKIEWDKGDATVPVPAKPMEEAKGALELKSNEYYMTPADETTPPSPWPDVTVSPREQKVRPIPTPVKVAPPAAFVPTPPRPAPAQPAYQPSQGGPGGPGGPGEPREHVMPDHDNNGGKAPDANASVR